MTPNIFVVRGVFFFFLLGDSNILGGLLENCCGVNLLVPGFGTRFGHLKAACGRVWVCVCVSGLPHILCIDAPLRFRQQAVGLFAAIPSARLARNVVSFNATVSACGRASQWQQAVDLFWAGEGALDVDAVGVCAAMSAYKKGSQWQSALGAPLG